QVVVPPGRIGAAHQVFGMHARGIGQARPGAGLQGFDGLAGVVPVQGSAGEGFAVLGIHGGHTGWRRPGVPADAVAPAWPNMPGGIGSPILPLPRRVPAAGTLFSGVHGAVVPACIDAGDQWITGGLMPQPLQPPQHTDGTMSTASCGTGTPAAARIVRTSSALAQVDTRRWPVAGFRSTTAAGSLSCSERSMRARSMRETSTRISSSIAVLQCGARRPEEPPRVGVAYLVTTSLPFIIEEWPGKLQKKV